MSAFAAFILLLGSTQVSGPELLVFSSPRCGPCQKMVPIVEQLSRMGYPVRKIDITRSPQWADQFGVNVVPTFIVVEQGQVVQRYTGETNLSHLQQMIESVQPRTQGQAVARGNSASQPSPRAQVNPASFNARSGEPASNQYISTVSQTTTTAASTPTASSSGSQRFTTSNPRSSSAPNQASPREMLPVRSRELLQPSGDSPSHASTSFTSEQILSPAMEAAMAATVRLRVTDASGVGIGTGTIIHQHGKHALVLTCGHLFESSKGDVQIEVEYGFGGDQRDKVRGGLLTYEYESHDVGLVVFEPRQPVVTAQVALPNYRPIPEDALFTIGCDHGADPSFRQTSLANITSYGTTNLVEKYDTTGRPAIGRSGGGLFTAGGQLIGVCNFAAQEVDEGTYAGMQSIYAVVDNAGLGAHFRDPSRLNSRPNQPSQMFAQQDPSSSIRGGAAQGNVTPSIAASTVADRGLNSRAENRTAAQNQNGNLDRSIIVLVPSTTHPGQMETRVIANPTAELMAVLQQHGIQIQTSSGTTPIEVADQRGRPQDLATRQSRTNPGNTDWNTIDRPQDGPQDGPQLRAQSPN